MMALPPNKFRLHHAPVLFLHRPISCMRYPPLVPLPFPITPTPVFFLPPGQHSSPNNITPMQDSSSMDKDRVIIREVWASNLDYEFALIASLIEKYPFVSMDTEFPGVIVHPQDKNFRNLQPADRYRLLKYNVDALNLIQVGLTFTDKDGNLPDLGTNGKNRFIWQFNFRDFNIWRDIHARDSVALLHGQGIDFARNAVAGVSSARFAELAAASGLLSNDSVTWVTFHGAYDFGYLVKILTRQCLPTQLEDFLRVIRELFGNNVYDVKHVMRFCNGLYGGLERVAQTLNIDRVAGKSHQAGSDSLLTLQAFHKIRGIYFVHDEHRKHADVLFGLEIK